jgi:hypothetical protein
MALTYDQVVTTVASYSVSVPRPLGVVFGENPEPYFGLVVDDVSEGMNAGRAGVRMRDQLLAINGKVVVGKDFDSVMNILQEEQGTLELVLHRGPVRDLFTILGNQLGDDESFDDDDDDEGEEAVIMDENYESPVVVEVKEQKPLTPADFFKAARKIGSMLTEKTENDKDDDASPPPPKKKTGFFGIGTEAIQLDGDDAKGYK